MTQGNLAAQGVEPHDPVYDALLAALRSNERGRAFLDEFARRVRADDTAAALNALARIEALLLRQEPAEPAVPVAEFDPHDATVPFEFEPPPDTAPVATPEPSPVVEPIAHDTAPDASLMAQVMALSPEERIALFS